jgi:hypothetical protein
MSQIQIEQSAVRAEPSERAKVGDVLVMMWVRRCHHGLSQSWASPTQKKVRKYLDTTSDPHRPRAVHP